MSESWLREAFRPDRDRGPVEGECPPAERIWMAVQGKLAEAEVRPLLDHAISCTTCDALFRLAREIAGEEARARRIRVARQSVLGLAAAAAVVLVATQLLRQPPSTAPAMRSGAAESVRSLTAPSLPRQAFVLRWSAGPPETRYALNVLTEDLQPLFRASGLRTAEHQVPGEALARVPSGAQVVWTVEASLPDGRRLESSAFLTRVE